jgi:hypothetical protein
MMIPLLLARLREDYVFVPSQEKTPHDPKIFPGNSKFGVELESRGRLQLSHTGSTGRSIVVGFS